jgi:hypothetical protein
MFNEISGRFMHMKNFDSRTYSIGDFIEWDNRKQLIITPKFQRRSVWSPQAKSYLIDTIIRDKPLPKIFLRATTDPKTKTTTREVVDGQQRLRAILLYIKDGFTISKVHNEEYGGKYFSELPDEIQSDILKYEISVDLLLDLDDRDVLDIFARLNTYSVKLNKQELFNAKYFGNFKQLVYKISSEFYKFWTENEIFSDTRIVRMAEAELATDLLIAIIDGMQSKKSAEKYYQKYDEEFDGKDKIEAKFKSIMDMIGNLFGDELKSTNFKRPPVFFGLFVSLYHLNYGIIGLDSPSRPLTPNDYSKVKNVLYITE